MNQTLNLNDFVSPGFSSVYKGIPIFKYTEQTRKLIRNVVGQPVRFKFRGPRPAKNGRSPYTRQSGCLKEDAVTFSVYLR
jgi:hypothetical protein